MNSAARWRNTAVVCALLLGATAFTTFRQGTSRSLDADSLTLHGAHGNSVTLSIAPNGELEARFDRGTTAPNGSPGLSLVLVDANGRIVARVGEPVARPLAR